jgi:hypothetical protein
MKKIILILASATLLSNAILAQNNTTDLRKKFMFGLKAGANYSNVYDAQGEEFHANAKFGSAAGAFLTIPMGTYFGIQPEILFSQKGFQATGRILNNTYNFTRTTNYIDVPLLFALKPSEFLTIVAGPQYSYLLKQTDVFANATTSIEQQTEFVNDNPRKNTLCVIGGLDLTLKHIVIGARAGWDVQTNNGNGTSTTPRYKNVWYQATVGYRFYNNN